MAKENVYEIDNPCFLADTFIFRKVKDKESRLCNKTIFVKVNSDNKIEEIGLCIEGRLTESFDKLVSKSKIASKKHKHVFRTIDHEFFALCAVDYTR